MSPRVLHVIGQLVPGGSEKVTLQLASRMGPEHEVLALGEVDDGFVASIAGDTVRVHRGDLPGRGPLSGAAALRALVRLVREGEFDVVQGHAWRSSVLAAVADRCTRAHGIATLHRIYYRRAERVADRWLQHGWRRVVVDSRAVADLLARDAGIDRERIVVIPNAVDARFFDTPPPNGAAAGSLRLLMAAHFTPVKGHRFALEAVARTRARGLDVTLDLLGDGPELGAVRRQAGELRLDGAVRFHGRRTDLGEWLRASDAVVLPSGWEGFGVVLAEALAAGRPAVAFAIGGATEVIDHEQTGLLTPTGDAAALAQAIERLARDPGLRRRLGEHGREVARERFGAEPVVRAYRELYECLR